MQIVEHFFQKEFLKFKNNITFADLKKAQMAEMVDAHG